MTIYVGRREYQGSSFVEHVQPNTTVVRCLSASTEYGCLSPYCLTDENGFIMENIWQFGKIYEDVPAVSVPYSRWNKEIIWEYPAQRHIVDGMILPEYWQWRDQGMRAKNPIRYPVGYHHRHKCRGYLQISGTTVRNLNYIAARREVYVPLYRHCLSLATGTTKEKFQGLVDLVRQGQDLTIVEVDGPKSALLGHYQKKYGVAPNFIVDNVMVATPENLEIMKSDDKSPYGHGYCLAECLLSEK